jgi:hypothetical protein
MTKLGVLSATALLVVACGSSSKGHPDGGTGGSGGITLPDSSMGGSGGGGGGTGGNGGTGGTGGSGGQAGQCNMTTGSGCVCSQSIACPNTPVVGCVVISDNNNNPIGGAFCSNTCTPATQATDCALSSGASGMGVCGLVLRTDGGSSTTPNHCAIVCGTGMACPQAFVGMNVTNSTGGTTCICVPPQ